MKDQQFLERCYTTGRIYLIRGWSVYQIFFEQGSGQYYTHKLYTKRREKGGVPLHKLGYILPTGNGRFINDLLGFDLLIDDDFTAKNSSMEYCLGV